jgi:transcriptional antiterminator RfaH
MKENESISVLFQKGLHWYPVQTKLKKERTVERRLRDLNLEVFLPWVRLRRRIGSRFQRVLDPLFPGYLFCRLDLFVAGKAARYAPGVKDFVRFGNRIAEVGDEVIGGIRERCPDGVAVFKPRPYRAGEPVLIREGPLSGIEAVFEREMRGSDRVTVLLELLGRQTRLILNNEMISRP